MEVAGFDDPGGNLFVTTILGCNNTTQIHGGKQPHCYCQARKPGSFSLSFILLKRYGAVLPAHNAPLGPITNLVVSYILINL